MTLVALGAAIVAISLTAGFGLARLGLDDGVGALFSSDTPRYTQYVETLQRFTPSEGDSVVVFESPDLATPERLQAISDFVIEASFLDGVADVFSMFSLRAQTEDGTLGAPLIPTEIPPDTDFAPVLEQIAGSATDGARLVSADRTMTAVIIGRSDDNDDTLDDLNALADIASRTEGLSAIHTGLPQIRVDIIDSLFSDLILLTVLGMAAGLVICALALRSIGLAVLVAIPAALALLWAMGLVAVLGFEINVLSITLPTLVLVLSFADGVHLTLDIARKRVTDGLSPQTVLAVARGTGPACLLASVTTAVAFLGLLFSGSGIIRDLGLAGAVATLTAVSAVLIVNTLVFSSLSVFPKAAGWVFPRSTNPLPVFDWIALPRLGIRYARTVLIAGAVLIGVGGAIYATIEPAYSVLENIDTENPRAAALIAMSEKLAPLNSIDIPIRLENGIDQAGLDRIDAATEIASRAAPDAATVSLSTFIPQTEPNRFEQLDDLLPLLSENQRNRLLSDDDTFALLQLRIGTYDARDIRRTVTTVETALDADPRTQGVREPAAGFLVMSSFLSADMIGDLGICFVIAVIASGALTAIWFRDWRYGLVALVPNILPIFVVGAVLALTGEGLQFASGIALTIAFGIAVDDTVHVLNRLRLHAPTDKPFDPASVRLAMAEVTPALVITTVVLSVGLVSTFFSASPMIGYFGALSIFVFIVAILADLIVLPALLFWIGRRAKSPLKLGSALRENR